MKKSESIVEIAKALCQFNLKVGKVSKDASNPFFKNKYASLDSIVDEVRPLLAEQGLSILQIPGGDGTNLIMKTLLIHESGEWIESDEFVMKPTKNDPQGIGSATTYARRYSLNAFLSLNTGEDDDGNAASKPNPKKQQEEENERITLIDATGGLVIEFGLQETLRELEEKANKKLSEMPLLWVKKAHDLISYKAKEATK